MKRIKLLSLGLILGLAGFAYSVRAQESQQAQVQTVVARLLPPVAPHMNRVARLVTHGNSCLEC